LADDHRHALIGLGFQLVRRRRERRRRNVSIDARREPRESEAGGEAHGSSDEQTASGAVDERDKDDTERKWCDPRQVPLRSHVRPSRVALSGL